jgi:CheY-like chemotaxis protein
MAATRVLDKGQGGMLDANRAQDTAHESPLSGGKILVVDDDDTMRKMATRMLTALGYVSACATNGLEGVRYYAAHRDEVELVLLDMEMPVMNGLECFRQLREINPELKVILLTGSGREGPVQQVLDEGALGLVPKPYEVAQLSEAIEAAFRKRPHA